MTRLVERGLTYVQAALRGFNGDFARRPDADARGAAAADRARTRERARAIRERRAASRSARAADDAAVLSSDSETERLVRVSRRYAKSKKRSKSAVRCKNKSLAKSAAGRA